MPRRLYRLLAVALLLAVASATAVHSPSQPQPVGVGGNWNLVFDDEFNARSLDLTKWRPNWLGSSDTAVTKGIDRTEQNCYDPKNVHVANGVLTLHAERRSCTDEQGITHPYASGMVTTGYSKFLYTYGLLEVRVWLPPGETQTPVDWPGVWESGANFPQDGELDIMEVQGRRLCWRFHYSSGAPSACPAVPEVGGWHVFSADWEPTYIKFYYDGQRVGKVTSGVTNAPMKINIDLALSSNIVVPVDVKVEYVRLWKPD